MMYDCELHLRQEPYGLAHESGQKIIYFVFSSKLSSCFQIGNLIKNELDEDGDKIYIFDTLAATYPISLMLENALALYENGESFEKICETLEREKENYNIFFSTNELDYLVRGGRLNPAFGMVGNVLNIKPILTFKDGEIISIDKVRGQKKAYATIISRLKESNAKKDSLVICYANEEDVVETLTTLLKNEFGVEPKHIARLNPTIGYHIGPSGFGIAFQKDC